MADSLAAALRWMLAGEVAEDSDSAVGEEEEQTRVATGAGMAYKNPSPPPASPSYTNPTNFPTNTLIIP